MTRDEIIRMAQKAGMQGMLTDVVTTLDELQYFAALVAAEEREVILKLTDSLGWIDSDAIRARGHVKESAESLTRSDNVLNKHGIRWEVEP